MLFDYDASIKNWDRYVHKLIKVAAKKTGKIEEKHQQIVKGALKVFLKKGYHPTTIREISEAAGMSLGQLYHYVSSKDDVLFLIHRHQQIVFFKHMKKMPPMHFNGDAVQSLVESLRHALPFLSQHKKLYRFILGESRYLNKEHLAVVLEMDNKNIVQYWRQLLEKIEEQKRLPIDIEFASNLITYLVTFMPMRGWNLKTHPIDAQQEMLIDSILSIIGIEKRQCAVD